MIQRTFTNWSVGLLRGRSLAELAAPPGAVNPIIGDRELADFGGIMAADPFALQVDGTWFLFFEMVTSHSPLAVIAAARSRNLVDWEQLGPVLSPGHHVSYPFVFEHDGEIFMMPESKKVRQVTIYRAVDFPHRWRAEKTILRGRFFDASMVRHEDRYWLFVGWWSYWLQLFHAPHPLGPWTRHAWPFVRGHSRAAARPGGRPILLDGKLIRFAQDNRSHYGHRLRAWHVKTMTPLWYAETPLAPDPLLEPPGTGWNARCMHHIDPHLLPDGTLVAFVDGSP